MNRIDQLFQAKEKNILSIYFTAGHPHLDDTITIIKSLENAGADMIEIGMPFSDPLADGQVIQNSSQVALKNGMSLAILLKQLREVRKSVKIPLLLMGYLNPVMKYGIEHFLKDASDIGIDGLILPDLPFDIYMEEYQELFKKHNLHNIFLITPQTSNERIQKIAAASQGGFLYMVSSASTTGAKSSIAQDQETYFTRIQQMNLPLPRLIGFGISNQITFQKSCQYANGAIIGSAFIKLLEQTGDMQANISAFINDFRK